MDNRIDVLREEIKQKLSSVGDLAELDKLRVGYLGKNHSAAQGYEGSDKRGEKDLRRGGQQAQGERRRADRQEGRGAQQKSYRG